MCLVRLPLSLRSSIPRVLIVVWSVSLMVSCDTSLEASSNRTNLLLVTIDTVRADRLGAYGYEQAKTPSIDALAQRGVLFEQAYTPAPMTLPAHSTMMTGLLPPEHGARVNGVHKLDDEVMTLAERLSANGYQTGGFVAAFVLNHQFGMAQGFERFDDDLSEAYDQDVENGLARYRPGDQVVDAALEWLQQIDDLKPFFAWVHLYDAHYPWHAHGEDADEDSSYDGEIAFVDQQFGRLADWVYSSGKQDNTIVVVLADHGEGLGDHHEIEHAYLLNEEVLHVPLIVASPSAKAGHRVKALVSLEDLQPTMLELLNVISEPMHGRSLVAALAGQMIESGASYAETDLPWTSFRWAPQRSLTTADWKYIRTPQVELYDRRTDRGEKANLAVAKQKLVEELDRRLKELEGELGSRSSTITSLSDEETEQLAALGYVANDTTELPEEWMDLADMKQRFAVKDLNASLRRRISAETISSEEHLAIALELVKRSPETPSFHAELGKFYAEQGHYDMALPALEHAIELAPNDPGLHYSYGDALQQMGRSAEARPHIELALEMVPDMAAAHVCMGNILRVEGRLDLATGSYAEAIRIREQYPEAHYNMGQVFQERGMPEDALQHFRTALEEKPGWGLAHRAIANLLLVQGDYEEALEHFAAAIEEIDSAEIRNDYGVVLQNLGRPKDALEQYLKAMELAPAYFRPHLNRGNLAMEYGNDQVALIEYNAAFQLAPSDVETNVKLARFLSSTQNLELRDIPRAVALAERAVDLTGGQSAQVLEILGSAYAAAERYPAALSATSRAQMLARAAGNQDYVKVLDESIALYALGEPAQAATTEAGASQGTPTEQSLEQPSIPNDAPVGKD